MLMELIQLITLFSMAQSLPAPTDPLHPGSKFYDHSVAQSKVTCLQRKVDVFQPASTGPEKFPVVVFGHGQALDVEHYRLTLEHLAKKGVVVLFPTYDTGFFDQDWNRMGSDYVKQVDCALKAIANADTSAVIFSGHSKGAYVASLAAGIWDATSTSYHLGANVFFAPAGSDTKLLKKYASHTATTVIFSDADSIVDKSISENIFLQAQSQFKQLITLKSYNNPAIKADHFWILTKSSFAGGKDGDNALHHYGAWKWLVAAAWDVRDGGKNLQPYLYGDLATDKGVNGLKDDLLRNN